MKGPPVKEKIRTHVEQLFMNIPPHEIQSIAEGFRAIWLDFEPKSIGGIKQKIARNRKMWELRSKFYGQ